MAIYFKLNAVEGVVLKFLIYGWFWFLVIFANFHPPSFYARYCKVQVFIRIILKSVKLGMRKDISFIQSRSIRGNIVY